MKIIVTQEQLEYFLLILVRMASFASIAPFFGHANVPARYKVGLAACLSLMIYTLIGSQPLEYATVWDYGRFVIIEAIAGMLIGLSANLCVMIISFAGRIIDMEIGLSMNTLYDPTTRQEMSVSGNFYYYGVLFLMLVSNMHYFLLSAMIDSYSLIPIGGAVFNESLQDIFVGFLTEYFIIGFRICLPVFAVAVLMNCIMGIMTKVAPQIHMFSVGLQLKVLAGLLVIFVTIPLLPVISEFIFNVMQRMVLTTMKGLY
ncbi:MAG: flagellar biosynthetic protein FliR [Lachnospiraceae bacterium]|nr:flagellar biosynthetic protein FliR [Lachnospiraceae bacterium]